MEENKLSMKSPVCAGCDGQISDRFYLLAADRQWHERCLKCCACHADLESELTCFCKHGDIYCKEDYYRCARCHLGISAAEIVMRARDLVYHLNCFSCATCDKVLLTGDHFGMQDTSVYCRVHFEMMLQGECHPDFYYSDMSPTEPNSETYTHIKGTPVQRGRSRKRKNLDAADHVDYNSDVSYTGVDLLEKVRQFSCQKSKRMRTSFMHHQLHSMQAFFTHNHNPDAKDLKELAQKTGLSKRVLQVWFQNARAKFRRNCLYQESMGADSYLESDNFTITSPSVPSPELSLASMSPSSPNSISPSQHGHTNHNTMSPSQCSLPSFF